MSKNTKRVPPCFETKIAKNCTQQLYFFRTDPGRIPGSIATLNRQALKPLQKLLAPGMLIITIQLQKRMPDGSTFSKKIGPALKRRALLIIENNPKA